MASLGTLFFLVVSVLLSTVNCQQPIVVPNIISAGGTFSVYCDATRLPGNLDNIATLLIKRMVTGTTTYADIVQYSGVTFPKNITFKNYPSGRNWTITINGLGSGTGNRNTMTTVLTVNDATCSDAGTYMCSVTYLTSSITFDTLNNTQNVTAVSGISGLTLTVFPEQSDYTEENITFTCQFFGPESARPTWELWSINNNYEGYTLNRVLTDAVTSNPVPQSNTGCPLFRIVSTLQVQLTPSDNPNMYRCVAKNGNEEESYNITIGTTSVPPDTGAQNTPASADVGMIVGIVIGCIAAIAIIIIIIFVVRYRKRSKEGNYKGNQDQPDAPNDNLHAPPPVFYPSSKPSKGSKEDKDSKNLDESGKHDLSQTDDYDNTSKNRKPYYNGNYNHDQETAGGRRTRKSRQGDSHQGNNYSHGGQHYASTDISQSGDESADQSDAPLDDGKSKPKPKHRSQVSRKDDRSRPGQLHYAALDLPRKNEGSESGSDAGRRREIPVEYAEIRV